jgi:hypothetical protein
MSAASVTTKIDPVAPHFVHENRPLAKGALLHGQRIDQRALVHQNFSPDLGEHSRKRSAKSLKNIAM